MIVVADSSPLMVLANIGLIDILPRLFGRVIIPGAVRAELQQHPPGMSGHFATLPTWIETRDPVAVLALPKLGAGEAQALSLAVELHADIVLVDDRKAFKAAKQHHLRVVGTVLVLEQAAEAKMINLALAFDALKKSSFWISYNLLDERLKLFQSRKGGP